MIVGCYTLHLYCDNYDPAALGHHRYGEFPHEFDHELGSTCRRDARRAGWVFNRATGSALCPKCVELANQGHARASSTTRKRN